MSAVFKNLRVKRFDGPFDWQRFWAAVGVIETIGIVVLCVWVLAGCIRPTFALVNIEASKPQRTAVEVPENSQQAAPDGDALENDPRWNQLKK